MWSPICIEPMHSFSHGYHCQRHGLQGHTYDKVTQYGAYTGQPSQTAHLQFDIGDPYYN